MCSAGFVCMRLYLRLLACMRLICCSCTLPNANLIIVGHLCAAYALMVTSSFPQTPGAAMQNTEMTPAPFTEAQISQLLSEYAELSELQLAPSSDDWAADIWQRTQGHRGLTTICGAQLEMLVSDSVLARERPVQLDSWCHYADNKLPDAARKRPTVSKMLQELQHSLETMDGKEQILELLEMARPSLT